MSLKIYLKEGKEQKILKGYPWIFRDEAMKIQGNPVPFAEVYDYKGTYLCCGSFSNTQKVIFRKLSNDSIRFDKSFFISKIQRSYSKRAKINSNAFRIVFSESDELSGLIIDKFDSVWVIQIRTAAMQQMKSIIVETLVEMFQPQAIYERSDMEGRVEEGLEKQKGLLYGKFSNPVVFEENGFLLEADIENGLKTGFYLDQRDNRKYIGNSIKQGEKVLDLFCYNGGFSIYAASNGAHVTAVDINEIAIDSAKRNAALNHVNSIDFCLENAFDFLEQTQEKFDLIIADPPAIAKKRKDKGSLFWAIWKLAYHAFLKLNDKGRLYICSCSYQVGIEDIIIQVKLAASDTKKNVMLTNIHLQPNDHPYMIHFPESLYLKCLEFQVVE